jgi:enolase-phosphatase E1
VLQFPHALKALPDVLKSKWDSEDFKPYRDAFPEEAKASPEALQAHVEDLTRRDVKIAYHKNLQGYLWEHGYESGEYATPLFADVVPKLKAWKEAGYDLAIYSSGSVFAQKLLFGHVKSATAGAGTKRRRDDGEEDGEPPSKKSATADEGEKAAANNSLEAKNAKEPEDGEHKSATDADDKSAENLSVTEDLQYLVTNWFDTTNAGPKTETSSYMMIADAIEVSYSSHSLIFSLLSTRAPQVVL